MRRREPVRLPLPVTAALYLVSACGLTLLALWCQPNPLPEVLARFQEHPVLYPLNFLPIALFLLAASFLFRNVFFGAAAADLIVCGLSVANRIKIEVRDEPVFPRDLALLKEVGSAVRSFSIRFPWVVIAAVLGTFLLCVVLGTLCRADFAAPPRRAARAGQRAVRKSRRVARAEAVRGWTAALLGAAVSLGALWALIVTVYSSDELYNSLEASTPYRLSVVFNENGFPYNFCRQFTKFLVDRPAGYSRAEAEAWDDAPAEPGNGKPVHVVMVMNEAFSDVTDDAAFAFTEADDPLKNLHAVQADSHGLALRLVVPGFAGGTANTEFDVFTGMQTNALGEGTTSALRTVNRNLDSLFRVFREDGYLTSFYHPGYDWFYNRENVFLWFGAEETRFIDEMAEPVYKGYWVSDAYLGGLIEDAFTDAADEGRLLFHSTTTIQNHMGYPKSKYGEDYPYREVPLSVPASDAVQSILQVYVEGVRDADALLGELRTYFAARTEPVLLVYYGDHLPYLGDNRMVYELLGMDIGREGAERENWFAVYETPCVLWANDAAAEMLDWETAVNSLDLPENGRLSAAFLGAAVLELTGRGRESAWTAFLNGLRRETPVVQGNVWMLADGTVVEDGAVRGSGAPLEEGLLSANRADLLKWRKWSYYKLEQKELR